MSFGKRIKTLTNILWHSFQGNAMEKLWDLQIINDIKLQFAALHHRIGWRGKLSYAPKSRVGCRPLPTKEKEEG